MFTYRDARCHTWGHIDVYKMGSEKAILLRCLLAQCWRTGVVLSAILQIRKPLSRRTHWSRVTHIWVSKLTIIGPDNGLAPGRHQAIIWTNYRMLLIRTLGTNLNEILSEIHSFSFKKMYFKMSVKWWQFCLGPSVIKDTEMCISATAHWIDMIRLLRIFKRFHSRSGSADRITTRVDYSASKVRVH